MLIQMFTNFLHDITYQESVATTFLIFSLLLSF